MAEILNGIDENAFGLIRAAVAQFLADVDKYLIDRFVRYRTCRRLTGRGAPTRSTI